MSTESQEEFERWRRNWLKHYLADHSIDHNVAAAELMLNRFRQAARSAPKETRGAELMGAKQEECCSQKERDMGLLQVVDDPSTIFYGPYPCEQCGALICCSALDQGGMAFDYPQGIIYPNTNWVQHVHKSILRIVLPEGTTAGCECCKKMVSAYWQACGCHLCDACYNNGDC